MSYLANLRASIQVRVDGMVDDSSSVSSLSTAVVPESSSFYSSTDRSTDVSFDLTLVDDDDDGDPAQQWQEELQNSSTASIDRRWESDPYRPVQRAADVPVMPPRRWSSKSSRGSGGKRLVPSPVQKKASRSPSRRRTIVANERTVERPRMPRRQLSDSTGKLWEGGVEEPERPASPSDPNLNTTTSPLFSQRMRRFPMEVPTRRKLPASRRIRRLSRPGIQVVPMRRNDHKEECDV